MHPVSPDATLPSVQYDRRRLALRPGSRSARCRTPRYQWLGTSAGVPPQNATLAELYALRAGTSPAGAVPVEIGGYR